MGYGPTKTDRPKHPLLVHAIATLCKPNQDPAQLRLSLIAIAQVLITCAQSHSWTLALMGYSQLAYRRLPCGSMLQ